MNDIEAATNMNPDRPSTDTDYRPVSGVAVTALAVTVLFVLLVLFLGGNSFRKGKPFLYSWLLGVAIISFVLSVVARFQIRRSEGTRSGIKLADVAWWLTVLIGGGYAAYFFASRYALDKQSQEFAMEWFSQLKKLADPDPVVQDRSFYEAFWRTLEPTSRSSFDPRDKEQMELEFATQIAAFRSTRLVKFFQRSGNDIQIIPQSMGNWEQTPTGYRVDQVFEMRAPEGVFEIVVHLSASEGKNIEGRLWRIDARDEAVLRTVTPYGFASEGLQAEARNFAQDWINRWSFGQMESTYLLTLPPDQRPSGAVTTSESLEPALFLRPSHFLVGAIATFFPPEVTSSAPPGADDHRRTAKLLTTYQNAALIGGSIVVPTLKQQIVFAELQSRSFFQLIPDKDQGSVSLFQEIWQNGGVLGPEVRMGSSEAPPTLFIRPNEIRVVIPIHLILSLSGRRIATAKVTARCTDPNLLRELQALHDSGKANPEQRGDMEILNRLPPRQWQILSIESNLKPVKMDRGPPSPPGGAGGM